MIDIDQNLDSCISMVTELYTLEHKNQMLPGVVMIGELIGVQVRCEDHIRKLYGEEEVKYIQHIIKEDLQLTPESWLRKHRDTLLERWKLQLQIARARTRE